MPGGQYRPGVQHPIPRFIPSASWKEPTSPSARVVSLETLNQDAHGGVLTLLRAVLECPEGALGSMWGSQGPRIYRPHAVRWLLESTLRAAGREKREARLRPGRSP